MSKNIPDYYRIPSGAVDLLGAVHPSTPHMLASAIEYLFRAGRKPGNTMVSDVRKAYHVLGRWLEQNDPAPVWPPASGEWLLKMAEKEIASGFTQGFAADALVIPHDGSPLTEDAKARVHDYVESHWTPVAADAVVVTEDRDE